MKHIVIPPLSMPVTEFASQGNALLGIKGSGKSYGATQIAEQLFAHGIPFITLDPSGVWRNLKLPADGGKGFPIVVAHPENGDLPLSPGSAVEIVRAAMRENVSLVLDLYSMKLSKADWRHIVQSVVDVLLYENKGLRHLFIEEAAEFCPQRVGPEYGRVYASIEKLARMGGNASLGYTLINQRAEEVNKAVLEICDCLLLFRQKGKNSLTSLEKWLTYSDKDSARRIVESLPTLAAGRCWIWPRGADTPTLCQVNAKKSFHPDRQHPDVKPAGAGTDVTKFVSTLNTSLEKVIAEAKANDPGELKREIRTLHQTIKNMEAISKVKAPADPRVKELEKQVKDLRQSGINNKTTMTVLLSNLGKALSVATARHSELWNHVESMHTESPSQAKINPPPSTILCESLTPELKPYQKTLVDAIERNPRAVVSMPRGRMIQTDAADSGDWKPGKAERTILTALSNYSHVTKQRLALLCGYSQNGGGFNNAVYALRNRGLICGDGTLDITAKGRQLIGPVDPLPTGEDLLNQWLNQLGAAERAILKYLYDNYGTAVSKESIAENTGYQSSGGGFNNAIYHLRGLGLIEGKSELKISDTFLQ